MTFYTKAILFLLLSSFLINCRDKVIEDYYGRPANLANPMYQQLQAKGNFKNFLACIDKAKYKRILSSTGYFTLFAPNDAAFENFFTANGYSSISDLDSVTAQKIVRYAIVYNAFMTDRLDDYQGTTGWVPSKAFKRRTAYYDGVYDGVVAGQPAKVLSANRNFGYAFGDNNNKYIPYFLDNYVSAKNLSAFDYNYFYPNTSYTGFNVVDASVVTSDIIAENGVIHEIDKVILPLPSLEQYIGNNPRYQVFKDLIEKYLVVYDTDPSVAQSYKILTGSNDPVYVKFYATSVSPNNENFLKMADNDGQSDGWSMFVPTNDVLTNYINTVLLEHYTSFDVMPPSIINDFINAHMWQTSVWPSKFASTSNVLGEVARFDPSVDVVDRKILSNGIFYGANAVQKSDLFHSVFGAAYLDPKYSLMTRYLRSSGLRSTLTNPNIKYTIFLLSDQVIQNAGFAFSTRTNQWTMLVNGSPTTTQAVETLDRLINLHLAITNNGEGDDLSGNGMLETLNGEYIKFNNNQISSGGNSNTIPSTPLLNVVGSRKASNGNVYYVDSRLRIPSRTLGFYIKDLGTTSTQPYYNFFQYLSSAGTGIYVTGTGDIAGIAIGTFYTVFIPSNAAMLQAVADGALPSLATSATWTVAQKTQVVNFIYYHIIPKFNIVPNGKEGGNLETNYIAATGDPVRLSISNSPGAIILTDLKGRKSNVVMASPGTNVLGNRAIIHQIDNYLNNTP